MRRTEKRKADLLEALDFIDPAALSYQEWLAVGMGLKEAGYPVSAWDSWSRRDTTRYHGGECERKWSGFRGSQTPVTAGTILQMARGRGWQPAAGGQELAWDDTIDMDGDGAMVDRGRMETREVQEPQVWDPVREMITYLGALFEEDDHVGYVTRSYAGEDGRYRPRSKGCFDRTAGELLRELERCGGDPGAVLGDCDPKAGAWIRFNPLDGKGVKNENVTDFRFALVESDVLPVERQNAILRELELPIAALVHSGGKSLHAIVRIDASSCEEYRARVDHLYSVCQKHGLEIDRQNRNPSRLSRLPGVMRNGQKQFLVDTNIGKASWAEWRDWMESVSDDLPDPEGDLMAELPELAPTLIGNVLRQGHKMLLAGPSKAGKSFALIELAVCIAEGLPWLGFPCARGPVMYVNLELDRVSCLHRFRDVRRAMGAPSAHSVDIWNLRGHSVPMDKLAPRLIRRAAKKNYIAVIIDPIYKVITGDENSADQMARFCNQFDKVCTQLGCAVIYCHHHSKGSQGGKRSMDRASGSGVFARDPDALLDLIELPVSEALRKKVVDDAIGRVCTEALAAAGRLGEASRDDLCSERAALAACKEALPPDRYRELQEAAEAARGAAMTRTAWRVEGTLREFPKFPPIDLWFDFPIHRRDDSGVLGDIDPEREAPAWQRKKPAAPPPKDRRQQRLEALETAFAACDTGMSGCVPLSELVAYLGKSKNTVRDYIDEHPAFERQKDGVRRVGTDALEL